MAFAVGVFEDDEIGVLYLGFQHVVLCQRTPSVKNADMFLIAVFLNVTFP